MTSVNTSDDTNEIWTLDFTKPFSAFSPPWEKLNASGYTIPSDYHTASIGGADNDKMIIFGGLTPLTSPPENSFTTFETKTQEWKTLYSFPSRRFKHSAVTRFNDSKIFIFGGCINSYPDTKEKKTIYLNELIILDSRFNTWDAMIRGNNFAVPSCGHTATLLSDGKMYLIGGLIGTGQLANMTDIQVYDTFTGEWFQRIANGDIPTPRQSHGAIGISNNKIIIFGGINNLDYSSTDVYILDTEKLPYKWKKQNTTGEPPTARHSHTMTMVGTNAIIAFGSSVNILSEYKGFFEIHLESIKFVTEFLFNLFPQANWRSDRHFYVLNTTTFTWQTEYKPNGLDLTKIGNSGSLNVTQKENNTNTSSQNDTNATLKSHNSSESKALSSIETLAIVVIKNFECGNEFFNVEWHSPLE
ncbi:hypothetical protein G9A89_021123 [Geosiphon pyriformis]|nr:hypothetical protein G9A89_021123 [Geosiphon pyriformis]